MRPVTRWMCAFAACAAMLLLVHTLPAGDNSDGKQVVIYPGDYVVQAGDIDANGQFKEGVNPSPVVIYPGEGVVQKADVTTLARWRIDVDPSSATATAIAIADSPEEPGRDAAKVEVTPHLNVSLIECENCGPGAPTSTRTIHIAGTFEPVPPATPGATWVAPAVGWPSTPASSGNVTGVSVPGVFIPPGPYANSDPFELRFDVFLNPVATFRIYVDVTGDIVEP